MTNPTAPSTVPLYLVNFNGKQRLIEAENLRDLKAFLLAESGLTHKIASGPEVMNFYKNGGKVETASAAQTEE